MTGTLEEMTCQELVELVTDYLEGALPLLALQRFELHLGACDGCTIYVKQMRHTLQLLGRLSVDDIPANEHANLLELFRDWRRAGP